MAVDTKNKNKEVLEEKVETMNRQQLLDYVGKLKSIIEKQDSSITINRKTIETLQKNNLSMLDLFEQALCLGTGWFDNKKWKAFQDLIREKIPSLRNHR